ncbi:MAG TPA: adenylate/guanylate cyclase domain-containing protein [Polyangia bacterium]|jgi:class 3 adenylate cyclase
MSLRTKWTAILLALGALPIALLAGISLRIQRHGLEESEKALGLATIDQTGDAVDRLLGEVAEVSRRTARLLDDPRIASGDARLELARETIARAPVVTQIAIYDARGALIDAIRKKDAEANAPAPTLAAAARGGGATEGHWLAPDADDPARTLRYVAQLGTAADPRGWLVGSLDGGALTGALAAISQARFDNPRRILLVGQNLQVVAGGDTDREAPGYSLQGRDIFAVVNLPAGAFSAGFAVTAEYTPPGGEPMVATLRTLPTRGWLVIVRRPTRDAYEALGAARRALVAVALAFSLLILVVGIWFGRRNTRPVASLVALTRAYASRDFARRSTVRTGDELQQLGESLERMADSLKSSDTEIGRRRQVEADLSRFLPAEVAQSISAGTETRLGGERRTVTVLFADVVSFTPFAESLPPEQVVAFLNQLFTTLTEVVFRHGGTVDKFMGDCVMAVFGAPRPQVDHVASGVAAAEDMQRFVEAQAPAWKQEFGFDVRLGIGINTGEVVVGNLGSEARMEYTVIGDVVNVAARLESLARPGQILVTTAVATGAGPRFRFNSLGQYEMRGKRQPVTTLELA